MFHRYLIPTIIAISLLPHAALAQKSKTTAVTSRIMFVAADPATPNVPAAPAVLFGDAAGFADSIYTNAEDSVVSILQPSSEWELNVSNSPTRRVWVDLGSSAPAELSASYYASRFVTHCFALNAVPPGQMTYVGQESVCPVTFRIDPVAGTYYRLSMNTANVASGDAIENDGGTTENVRFTCTAVAGGSCSAWSATPADSNGDGRSKARLTKFQTVNRKTVKTAFGFYDVAFRVEIAKP